MHKHHLLSKVARVATLSTIATLSISAIAEVPPLPVKNCPDGTETIAKFDSPDAGKDWGYRYYDDNGNLINIVNLEGANWTSEAPISHIVCKGATIEVPGSQSGVLPEPCASSPYTALQFCGNVGTIPQCSEWKFAKDSFEDGTTGRNFVLKTNDSWAHDPVAGRNIRNPQNWLPAPKYKGEALEPSDGINEAEIHGIAIKETMTVYRKENDPAPSREGQIMVAFNTNIPLKGSDLSWLPEEITKNWTDKLTGLGDLIFDFDGVKYGVHFSDNDSGVKEPGVYKNIATKDVTGKNWGWPSLKTYMAKVLAVTGKKASCGDVPCEDFPGYGDNRYGQIVIKTGTKIADIKFLGKSELPDFAAGLGVDASQLGQYTYGFKFSKEASGIGRDEVGEVTAHIFMECFNDGVAIKTALGCDCVADPNPGLKQNSRGCELLGEGVNSLVAVSTDKGIELNWEMGPFNGILNVVRAEKDAEGQYINHEKIASGLASDATTYTDKSALSGKTYYYTIEQVGLNGNSTYSAVVSATR